MPDRHVCLADYDPTEGLEEEFDDKWLASVQEDVDNVWGFVSAQRFRIADRQRLDFERPWRHVTLYELEGDADRIHADYARSRPRLGAPHRLGTPIEAHIYSPVGTPVRRDGWGGLEQATRISINRSNPAYGEDDAYNRWYDNHLVEDLAAMPGWCSGDRFRVHPRRGGESQRPGMALPARWQYISVYEIDGRDLETLWAENNAALAADAFLPHNGLIVEHLGAVFDKVGDQIVRTST